jgi:hypothetical protein
MKLNPTTFISLELTEEEKKALILTHDVIAHFNNKVREMSDKEVFQSPFLGDVIELDELPRMVGVINFFINNPFVQAIDKW